MDKENYTYIILYKVCVYIHTMEYYSAVKKNEIMSFVKKSEWRC
jgi:hypothetical protein